MKNKSIRQSEPHFHFIFCIIVYDSGEMRQNKEFSYGTMRRFLQQLQSLKMFKAPNCAKFHALKKKWMIHLKGSSI